MCQTSAVSWTFTVFLSLHASPLPPCRSKGLKTYFRTDARILPSLHVPPTPTHRPTLVSKPPVCCPLQVGQGTR